MSNLLTGTVISNKMEKTIVVKVERVERHPRYHKVIKSYKKYKVHCEDDKINLGDKVSIQETRPISKFKHFKLVEKKS